MTRCTQRGYFLPEILATIAIGAGLLATAVPFVLRARTSMQTAEGYQNDVLDARQVLAALADDLRAARFAVHEPGRASVFTTEGRVDYAWNAGTLTRTAPSGLHRSLTHRLADLQWREGLGYIDIDLTLKPRQRTADQPGPRLRAVFALGETGATP